MSTARSSRRTAGFALPLTVLLSLVVGLMTAVALARHGAQTLMVQRQLEGYQVHHASRGIQEAVSGWLKSHDSRRIRDALGENGHAFDVELPDGSTVSVYLSEGQGTVLSDLSGLSGEELLDAGGVLANLAALVPPDELGNLTRRVGPPQISPQSAPEPVLRALLTYLLDGPRADRMLDAILELRGQEQGVTRQGLIEASTAAGVEPNERNLLLQMLAIDPELWHATIEVRGGRGVGARTVTARYRGLTQLRQAGARNASALYDRPGAFLTWEELGVE